MGGATATTASFDVGVDLDDLQTFARLSGDFNPLHADPDYARQTEHGRQVLHGAFSAGLVSRMAGMFLPGKECLLHGIRLRFVAPILPPARLKVSGTLTAGTLQAGTVEVSVTDQDSGRQYVQASYEFGTHAERRASADAPAPAIRREGEGVVLVTGATGGLGGALLRRLGPRGLGLSRSGGEGLVPAGDREALLAALDGRPLDGIVHAGWPMPDNVRLLKQPDSRAAIDHQIAAPLADMLELARWLAELGKPDALLVLVGSAFARPGRHGFRTPLYSLAKSMVPVLAQILALELAAKGKRCAAAVFDVIDSGMNKAMSPAQRQMQSDRVPAGRLPDAEDAAGQILWMLENGSFLMSGATMTLTGGALP